MISRVPLDRPAQIIIHVKAQQDKHPAHNPIAVIPPPSNYTAKIVLYIPFSAEMVLNFKDVLCIAGDGNCNFIPIL